MATTPAIGVRPLSPLELTELAIDCADPRGLAGFWCSVLDYEVQDEANEIVTIGSPAMPEGKNRPVGQTGDEDWVCLSDPEGNEFCVWRAGDPDRAAHRARPYVTQRGAPTGTGYFTGCARS